MNIKYDKIYVKFNDTIMVNIISEEHISIKFDILRLNLKGSNVKYIKFLLPHLFHYHSIYDLYEILQQNNETKDISIGHLTEILYKLIQKDIIDCNDINNLYNAMYDNISPRSSNSVAVYSFIRPEQLEPLLETFKRNKIDFIRIISFLPPLDDCFQFSQNIGLKYATYEQVNITCTSDLEKYLALVEEDILITIQSSEFNYLLNDTINSYVCENSVPWLNVNITPKEIEFGPFVIKGYLGDYEYYKKMVKRETVSGESFYIKENFLPVNEKLRYTYSFLANEVKLFFTLRKTNNVPWTFNRVLVFKNRREFVDMIDILRLKD